jgi:methylphosphotriester-DNA--protein-cysteine methyltransferase
MNPTDFQKIALDLQTEMQTAIAEAEKLGALSKADHEAAADALMLKADVLRRCENDARDTAEAFFAENGATFKAQYHEEMLAAAARQLRQSGKTTEEIAPQLGVDSTFLEKHLPAFSPSRP